MMAPADDRLPMTSADSYLAFEHVSHSFAGSPAAALSDINLTARQGETVVLLGPSGCGKTTLLRIAAGLVRPTGGRVLVRGKRPVPGVESAIVFQSFRLLPWKTVAGNVAFALPDLPEVLRAERVRRYVDLVGLTRFADAYPAQLSGGMRQRTALARALAREPGLLLMDEPFASLDAQSRELMQAETMRLTESAAHGPAILFVTHSVDEALLVGDRVVLLSPRPGRVAEVIDVPFPRPRWRRDPRGEPNFGTLRRYLWERLRSMVLTDPASDFYGRLAE